MDQSQAHQEANRLIDLTISGDALFDEQDTTTSKGLLELFARSDKHRADPNSEDDTMARWEEAERAVNAVFESDGDGQAVLDALADILQDDRVILERRRKAAGILSRGPIKGKAAEVLAASVEHSDPLIVNHAIDALLYVPKEVALRVVPAVENAAECSVPKIARLARTRLYQLQAPGWQGDA